VTDTWVYKNEPQLDTHLGFILAEEDAVKQHLNGLTVPERPDNDERTKVGVWFRWPEGERQIRYPFVTIDLLSVEPNFDLWTSDYYQDPHGLYWPSFYPDVPPPPDGWGRQDLSIRNFLSFRLIWQVSHFARSALHDRYLTSVFLSNVLPVRPFFMRVPADDTWRRCEVTQMVTADSPETTESGTKRIFRKIYTMAMLAEVPQDDLLDSAVYRALRVLIPVTSIEQFDNYYRHVLEGQPDPINDIPQPEREEEGEYFHITHQGHDVPAP
jgi:hypothetical protein